MRQIILKEDCSKGVIHLIARREGRAISHNPLWGQVDLPSSSEAPTPLSLVPTVGTVGYFRSTLGRVTTHKYIYSTIYHSGIYISTLVFINHILSTELIYNGQRFDFPYFYNMCKSVLMCHKVILHILVFPSSVEMWTWDEFSRSFNFAPEILPTYPCSSSFKKRKCF